MYHEDKPVKGTERYSFKKKKKQPTTAIKVIDMQSPVKWFYRNGCYSSQAQFICIQAKAFMQAIFVMKFDFSFCFSW